MVLLALLVLALILVVGVLAYLSSEAGGARMRDLALEATNDAISGKVEARRVHWGGNNLVLEGVVLRDPEGNLVAEIARVEARVSLWNLLLRRIELDLVALEAPRFYLRQDDRGLNLVRALKAKKESKLPTEEDRSPARWGLSLDKVTIEEGHVDFIAEGEDEDLRATADAISTEGHFTLSRLADLEAGLKLDGRLLRPVEGPLRFNVELEGDEQLKAASLEATVAGLMVEGTAALSGTREGKIELKGLTLEAPTARALLPSYPLIATLRGAGSARLEDGLAKVELTLNAGSAEVKVDGGLRPDTLVSPGLRVTARGVNLAELLEDMPPSDLALTLDAEGGGKSLETLTGKVKLEVPQSTLKGQAVGPIRLDASAQEGNFRIAELLAKLPGLELTGRGRGTLDSANFSAHLEARDLSQLSKTFGALTEQKSPKLAGSGALDVTAFGPVRSPGVTARGGFALLRLGTNQVRDLRLDAHVPDVTRPLESQLELQAGLLRLGEREFRELQANLATQNRDLRANLRARGFTDVTLLLAGTLDEDSKGLLLRELALTYPEAEWTLQGPAQLRFGDGRLSTERLTLAAGPQSISVEAIKEGERVEAKVAIAAVDLALLPRALVDPALNLAGKVDLQASARGTLPRPELTAKGTLRGGRVRELEGVDLDLDGAYAGDRARGSASVNAPFARARLEFDSPVQGLLRRRPDPVHLVLELPELELKEALAAARQSLALDGRAGARIVVSGQADQPLLAAKVTARALRFEQQPPEGTEAPSFDLQLQSAPDGKLSARLDLVGATGFVAVRTPWTVGGLIQSLPNKDELRRTPLEVEVKVEGYPLDRLPTANRFAGALNLAADLKGTLQAPLGTAKLVGSGLAASGVPPTEVQLDFAAKEAGLEATLTASRPTGQLANLVASFGAPLGRLFELESLSRVPLKLDGTVGPVALAELTGPTRTAEEQATRNVQGLFRAEVHVDGNLDDPRAEVRGWLEQFGVGNTCLGKAKVSLDYRDAVAKLDLVAASTGSGTLGLQGQGELDLSLAGTRRGVKLDRAPLRARLKADKFDLAFLTGITPMIRQLGGTLRADGEFAGTFKNPDGKLTLEWVEGRLALEGYGEYRNIHLALDGDRDRIQLTELALEGSGGKARLTAELKRVEKRFELVANASAEKFPVIVDDQLMAFASLRADAEGTVSDERVHLRQLKIPEAHVYLPEKGSKDLQDLDRPNDVVLVKNGKPLQKRRQKAQGEGVGGAAGAPDVEHDLDPEDPPREYLIVVNAPRNLWAHGPDVNIEVGLSEGFRFEKAAKSNVYGEVRILRGRGDVLGRRFDLERGSVVRFTGPLKTPFINVTATHVNDREGIKVKLAARGQGKDLKLSAQSEPPLSESEIYTLLATGRRTLKPGAGGTASGTAQVASIAGSWAASQMKTAIQNVLPINFDVLSIEAGEEGIQGTRIEMGFYATDRWYVGFAGKVGADPMRKENRAEIRTEYQLTPRWNFEGFCGDAKTCGADILWHRDF